MTRVLGFVVGVSLTIAAFALLLPRSQHPAPRTPYHGPPVNAVTATGLEAVAADVILPGPADQTPQSTENAADETADATPQPADDGFDTDASNESKAPVPRTATTREASESDQTGAPADVRTPWEPAKDDSTSRTHVFWSPFRSAWAARGFTRRLSNATQIDIKVVETGPGRYRAAFDYHDDDQRIDFVERIESTTGLELD